MTEEKPGSHSPFAERRGTESRERLLLAFAIAAISDILSFALSFAPPIQWTVDIVTALLLFLLLGRQWLLLPGLIAEAVPGLNLFPFWILVVGSIAIWGSRKQLGEITRFW